MKWGRAHRGRQSLHFSDYILLDMLTTERKSRKKRGKCPICLVPPRRPNRFVRYHVRYGKRPIVILACKFCNYVEYQLRNGLDIVDTSRAYAVSSYMLQFGIRI